jgi:hypothetical protein
MIERACRITQVNRPEHLRASDSKPWRDCESNDERLDGENGLLLTGPWITCSIAALKRMGIPPDERRNVGALSEGQRRSLEYHRGFVFLEARVRRE